MLIWKILSTKSWQSAMKNYDENDDSNIIYPIEFWYLLKEIMLHDMEFKTDI